MGNFEGFGDKKGEKSGGIHESDHEGGIYKSTDGKNTYLIKRDVNVLSNDIAEYLAAELFDELCPGTACKISLHKSTETGRTFLASEFFKDNYKDLFKELGKEDRNANIEAAQSIVSEKAQYVKQGLAERSEDGVYKLKNYEQMTVASLLLDDKSIHSGNIGVVDDRENLGQRKLVRIDFGAAFRSFSSDLDPMESQKNRIGLEKNYFRRDHPEERIYTQEFVDELRRESEVSLHHRIEKAWEKIVSNYDNDQERDAIKHFGEKIGVSPEDLEKQNHKTIIKERFGEVMKERQQSMRNMATEIEVKMVLDKPIPDREKLQEAVARNPKHVEFMLNNPDKLQMQYTLSEEQHTALHTSSVSNKREAGKIQVSEPENVKTKSVAKSFDIDSLDPVDRTAVIHHTIKELKEKYKNTPRIDMSSLDNLDAKFSKGMNKNGGYDIKMKAEDAKTILHQLGEMSKAPEEISSRSKFINKITNENLSVKRKITSYIKEKFNFPPKDIAEFNKVLDSLDKSKSHKQQENKSAPTQSPKRDTGLSR